MDRFYEYIRIYPERKNYKSLIQKIIDVFGEPSHVNSVVLQIQLNHSQLTMIEYVYESHIVTYNNGRLTISKIRFADPLVSYIGEQRLDVLVSVLSN